MPNTQRPDKADNKTQPRPRASGAVTEAEVEAAARAIWDLDAGDCNENCRWGEDISNCWCQETSLRFARAALEAAAAVRQGERLDRYQRNALLEEVAQALDCSCPKYQPCNDSAHCRGWAAGVVRRMKVGITLKSVSEKS